jgi:hypothetical protein
MHKDKSLPSWTIGKLRQVISEEWKYLYSADTVKKISSNTHPRIFVFPGEVTVSVELIREPYAPADEIHTSLSLSLSPLPFDDSTHVLNTFDMGYFIGSSSVFHTARALDIRKNEAWSDSEYSRAIGLCGKLIDAMKDFDTCFDMLTKSTFDIEDIHFDTTREGLTQFLTRVKAYRFAEIYNRTDKLESAISAIEKSARTDELSRKRIIELCNNGFSSEQSWLYTDELIDRLRSLNIQ